MGMSAYPPGVSGMEPQIAGLPEAEMNVSCSADVDLVAVNVLSDLRYRKTTGVADYVAALLDRVMHDVDEYTVRGECRFEGPVTVQSHGHGVITWTCPACDTDHEDELSNDD